MKTLVITGLVLVASLGLISIAPAANAEPCDFGSLNPPYALCMAYYEGHQSGLFGSFAGCPVNGIPATSVGQWAAYDRECIQERLL